MKVIEGDLLSIDRGILVHGCNCKGVMGAGVAGQIAKKWPSVYQDYARRFKDTYLCLGMVQYYLNEEYFSEFFQNHPFKYDVNLVKDVHSPIVIANAMTQFRPGPDANLDAIVACMAHVKMVAKDLKLPVYFPEIGCGIGGLKWDDVGPAIDNVFGPDFDATLVKYVPGGFNVQPSGGPVVKRVRRQA